jgi:hypothetical protein
MSTSKTILELIAETIEHQPVLGHWPHMRAQADAEYLRDISKQWSALSDEIAALRAAAAPADPPLLPAAIARLRLEPGDVLVIKTKGTRPTAAMVEQLRDRLRELLPKGFPALIFDDSIEMSVVSRGEGDANG